MRYPCKVLGLFEDGVLGLLGTEAGPSIRSLPGYPAHKKRTPLRLYGSLCLWFLGDPRGMGVLLWARHPFNILVLCLSVSLSGFIPEYPYHGGTLPGMEY